MRLGAPAEIAERMLTVLRITDQILDHRRDECGDCGAPKTLRMKALISLAYRSQTKYFLLPIALTTRRKDS